MERPNSSQTVDFCLTNGEPLARILRKGRPAEPGHRSSSARRAVVLAAVTWLPLLILSLIEGVAFGNKVIIPFVLDFAEHVRLLFAVPLFIIAEGLITPRILVTVRQFVNAGLISEPDQAEFELAVVRAIKRRDSIAAEVILLVVVILFNAFGLRIEISGAISTWKGVLIDSVLIRTLAGWWFSIISMPGYQFLLLRWLWRYTIWSAFLYRIAGLNLELIPTHPDRAGGLGFLGYGQIRFAIIVFAASAVAAAALGEKMVYAGASLASFRVLIPGYIVFVLVLFLAPLMVFTPRLIAVKRDGFIEYGALGAGYTRSFDRKWVRGENPEGESLLGTPDLQSLADLGNSFEIIDKMRAVPFDLTTVGALAAGAIAPFVPLIMSVVPLEEILRGIFKLVL